jgi:3-oxoacyl-[acyl-carrier protein] reductase
MSREPDKPLGIELPVPIFPDLDGKVAVVTGGSKGIGAATARMLARNGVKTAVVARSQGPIDALVEELRELGAEAIGISADVTSGESLAAVREQTERAFGPVDILMPYAGGFESFTPVWEIEEEEFRRVIDDNLTSTFLALRAFLPGMRERRRGAVVAMASVSGRFLDKLVTASYAASKAAVVMYVRHAAIELGEYGVRLNAIAPATVYSERIDRIMSDEAKEYTRKLSPLGRMGVPDDCATASLFLASDAASWLTGNTIDVAGGRVML